MTWKEALRLKLQQLSAVASIVGDRITHDRRPQRTELPALTFFAVSRTHGHCLDNGPTLLPDVRVQIDCLGRSSQEAEDLAAAVRDGTPDGLDGFRGDMHGLFVQAALIDEAGRDDYATDPADSDRGTHMVSLDLMLSFEES